MAQHREHSTWYAQIANVTIEKFESREEALAAETQAIRRESPRFNIRKMLAADPELEAEIGSPNNEEIDQGKISFDNGRLYTVSEVAGMLGLGDFTINKYIKEGKLGALVLQINKRFWRDKLRVTPVFRITAGQIADFVAGLPVYVPTKELKESDDEE